MATDLGLRPHELRERAARLVAATAEAFGKAAAEIEGVDSDLPERLADAVAARARRCALMIS